MGRIPIVLLILLAIISAAGCATTQAVPQQDPKDVELEAARWLNANWVCPMKEPVQVLPQVGAPPKPKPEPKAKAAPVKKPVPTKKGVKASCCESGVLTLDSIRATYKEIRKRESKEEGDCDHGH